MWPFLVKIATFMTLQIHNQKIKIKCSTKNSHNLFQCFNKSTNYIYLLRLLSFCKTIEEMLWCLKWCLLSKILWGKQTQFSISDLEMASDILLQYVLSSVWWHQHLSCSLVTENICINYNRNIIIALSLIFVLKLQFINKCLIYSELKLVLLQLQTSWIGNFQSRTHHKRWH